MILFDKIVLIKEEKSKLYNEHSKLKKEYNKITKRMSEIIIEIQKLNTKLEKLKMKPIDFKESNKTLLGYNKDILDLKVRSDGSQNTSCWKMSWKERFSALFFGKVWISILSGESHHPIYLEATKEFFTKREF